MLLLVSLAAAACSIARTVEELRGALGEVESAWGRDMGAFESGMEGVRGILPCVSAALDPQTAGAVHRAEGLAAFSVRDMESARRSFAAARSADPDYEIPVALAPEGNPLRAEWGAMVVSVAGESVGGVDGLSTVVDGQQSATRAVDRPAVVQYVDPSGRAQLTSLVAGDAIVPLPGIDSVAVATGPTRSARPIPWGWMAASVATGIAGALLLEHAFDAERDYSAASTKAEADALRGPVNERAAGATVCGVAAVGFGAVAVVKGIF